MKYYDDLKTQLAKKGIDIINGDFYNQIKLWKEWYAGDVADFHHYNLKLADGTNKNMERLTMNLAKKNAEDMQKLLWSDKVEINLDTDEKTIQLWDILNNRKNNFDEMFPKTLELTSALGTTAITEFIDNEGDVNIEYIIDAERIIPYMYSNGVVDGFVTLHRFVREENEIKWYYTHLIYHEYVGRTYKKYHELYKSKDENQLGKEIEFNTMFPDVEVLTEYENVEVPHFQIFTLPIANNYDLDVPLGISIFANSLDRYKAIDKKYDSFTNEFELGKKRILVDQTALKGAPQVDEKGNVTITNYFDKNDTTYVAIRGMENQPAKEIDFNLRTNEHIDAINSELGWLGSNLGFGEDFYQVGHDGMVTATQILSEDSDAFRTKANYELSLKKKIIEMVKAICYLAGIETKKVEVVTDYSRFKDEKAEQTRMLTETDKGITSKVEYRMNVYKEDEEEAKKKIAEIKENDPTVRDLLGE